MQISKLKLSELSEDQIKRVEKLTISESSFLRYLYNYVDFPSPENDRVIYLAENAAGIVGWTLVGLDEDFGMDGEGTIHLNIAHGMRGNGLGTELFEKGLEEVISLGFKKIYTYGHDEVSSKFFKSEKIQNLCSSKGVDMEVIE